MFDELIQLWIKYQRAIKANPYVPDTVQAHGLAFANAWRNHEEALLKRFKLPAGETFGYHLHHDWMPSLYEAYSNIKAVVGTDIKTLKPNDPGFEWPACDQCGSRSLRCGCD